MHKDVSHGLDLLISVISSMCSLVSTRVCVILVSSSAKSDSRITGRAVILIIANKTDSCFGDVDTVAHNVKPFLVTVRLQGSLLSNQRLPRVTTQWGGIYGIARQRSKSAKSWLARQ